MKIYAHQSDYGTGELFFRTKAECMKSLRDEFPNIKDSPEHITRYTLPRITPTVVVAVANGWKFAEKVESIVAR